jgi:hypothetical protein
MTPIVRGLARRSKSNNFYKTIFFLVIFQCIGDFISLYKSTFANAKAILLLCKIHNFSMRNVIGGSEKGAERVRAGRKGGSRA